jgi:hypothetical protein
MDSVDTAKPPVDAVIKLRRLGFFDEFIQTPGQEGSIRDAVRGVALGDAADIARYLDSGPLALAFVDTPVDVIDGVTKIPEGGSLLTDGTWVWGTSLSYYFRRYNIALPDDFLRWVRSRNYVNPWDGLEDLSMNVTW